MGSPTGKTTRINGREVPVAWECSGNPKQAAFLTCPADEILYGGSAGCGKTDALIVAATGAPQNHLFTNPNWRVLILRRTFPELEKTIILRTHQLFSAFGKYDGNKHRWSFPGGGLVQFGHIQNNDDVIQYQSAEYSLIIFDELTHFTERMYLYLFSRLRTTDPTIRCKIKAATNPGGVGHAWVKKRFIDDLQPMKIYKNSVEIAGVKTEWSKCYIPASVFDNQYIMKNDPMYVRRLMELPETEKRALLYGDWDIFSGQFFPEFTEDLVIDGFDVPENWPCWIAMDWGSATKCAIGFYTQDPDTDVYYMFDEIYCSRQTAYQVASLIKSKLGARFTNLRGRYADKRIMVKDEDTQISTKSKFAMEGLHFQLATDDRVQGWHAARELLMKNRDGQYQFQVFRKCKEFIRTMQEQIFAPNNAGPAEDLDKKGETHHPDQFRYFAIMRKTKPTGEAGATPVEYSSVTGYLGMTNAGSLLRHRIPRLTNLKKGVNYFLDKRD